MTVNAKLKAGQYDNQDARVADAGGSGRDADLVIVGDGSGNLLKVTDNGDGTATLNVASGATSAANVLDGFQSFTATTAATTLITVPAGRTWVGTVGVACAASIAAASATAGQARAVVTVAGAGATPAAGTLFAVEARAGANAATGTVGSNGHAAQSAPLTVIAPAGNAVTVQVATTQAGTYTVVDAFAAGALQ